MQFEIWDQSKPDVSFTPASVTFPAFEFYRVQAQRIADEILNTEVTEENIADVKKLLADARKVTDGLNQRRIEIKKEILRDYEDFEDQVKTLALIISDADHEVRAMVRQLDEEERNKKEEVIRELWNKRVTGYQIEDLAPDAFNAWLTPQMLNKSTSMKAVETDMVEWLEASEKAIDTLKSMDDEYLVEYLGCFDFTSAVATVNNRNEMRARITNTKDEDTEEKAIFVVYGKKDIKLTESLLNENEIEYQRQ